MNTTKNPSISLVVTACTTERLHDIYELLDSVRNQTCKNMETIFVVERSKTLLDMIHIFVKGNPIPNMMVVFSDDELGLSAARNLGIKHAKGEIIAFVDDDVLLYTDWAEEMRDALEKDPAIGLTGAVFPLWENESLKWLPEEFYWLISCTAWTGWKEQREVRGVFGANMGFKREAFADDCLFASDTGYTRGSHHQPVSDDLEFSLRVRKRTQRTIIFNPRARVWHRVGKQRLSLQFVAKRAHQVGCTRQILKKHYPKELGKFEQENHVLKGIFSLIRGLPKELLTKPRRAWDKLLLICTVLVSITLGYVIPVSSHSFKIEKGTH